MSKLKAGDKAPLFSAPDHNGNILHLKDLLHKKIVLYFYPKDNTPTCTTQACNLRDHYKKFQKQGFEIVGVSMDNMKKHQNFIKKYKLPFILVSDPDHSICEQYGVWGEKVLFGRHYLGIIRTTFVINTKGIIEEVIDAVESARHAEQIL